MSEEIEQAENALAKAGKALGPASNEGKYADAYQALVRLGARPQLRRKYR